MRTAVKKMVKVRPLPGMKCRRPLAEGGQLLDQAGELVNMALSYWRRRLKAKDIEPVVDDTPPAVPTRHNKKSAVTPGQE